MFDRVGSPVRDPAKSRALYTSDRDPDGHTVETACHAARSARVT
jgi:hypothetical protein